MEHNIFEVIQLLSMQFMEFQWLLLLLIKIQF